MHVVAEYALEALPQLHQLLRFGRRIPQPLSDAVELALEERD